MSSTRAHLPSGQGHKVDVRPFLLNSFTMRPSHPFCEVERVIGLTGKTVARKMKLRDQVGELEPADIKVWVVLGKTPEMVD